MICLVGLASANQRPCRRDSDSQRGVDVYIEQTMTGSQPQRRGDTVTKTTAVSGSAAGAAAVLLWLFGMIDAGRFFVPPAETALFLGAAIVPIYEILMNRMTRKLGGENGQTSNPGSSSVAT